MRKLLAIVGPTASGKSELALQVAEQYGGEIVSADSMQVYRGMDIGTAKPSLEDRRRVTHHLIDVADPGHAYSVGRYQHDAREAIRDVNARGALPILVGGSGLYVNSITHRLDLSARPEADPELRRALEALPADELYARLLRTDPQAAARVHPHNVVRVRRALEIALSGPLPPYDFGQQQTEYDLTIVGLERPRDALYDRINERVDHMMDQGLAEEVEHLYQRYGGSSSAMQAIGYKEIVAVMENRLPGLKEAADLIRQNTRRFAKRQLTWFRRDCRIRWLDAGNVSAQAVIELLENRH